MAQPDSARDNGQTPEQRPASTNPSANPPADGERSIGTGPMPGRAKDDPASAPESGDKPEAAAPRNPQGSTPA
jgi:hypothetical protein